MIQFLFQGGHGSHGPRAQALAASYPGSRCGEINDTDPSAVVGLDTLTFWGHGDAFGLCGKTSQQLFTLIRAWKRLNAGLRTIELITCNARHAATGDPFATSLKSRFGYLTGTHGLVVKALPVAVGGSANAWSILLAETTHNSWCYVTAPDVGDGDLELHRAADLIRVTTTNNRRVSYRGDIAARANEVVKAHPVRKWTMNYGYFPRLRDNLVVVR